MQLTDQEYVRLKAIYRADLSKFIRRVFSIVSPNADYVHNWHIDLIAEYLRACENGEIKRLIINVPPRSLKSISISIAFSAWLLGHNPAEEIIGASCSHALAEKLSNDTRAVMNTDWYRDLFPGTRLFKENNHKLITTERGQRYAASTTSTIIGEGGNYIIIDDPLNAKEAGSRAVRESVNDWFDSSVPSRLNNKSTGVIILVMQRLHMNDLTGYLLEKGGWEHLNIPLLAEKDEVLSRGKVRVERKVGDNLSEKLWPTEWIKSERRQVGEYNFSGQYQQSPNPIGGGEFKKEWINFYKGKLSGKEFNNYIMVDPANSKRKESDYTCMIVLGLGADKNIYVLDVVRDKLNIREREETLFALHAKWRPKYVLYEKYGMMVDADVMRKAMDDRNYRFVINEVAGTLNKEDRIRRLIPYFADGRMWFPEQLIKTDYEGLPTDIMEEFIHEEYLPFPVGLHDDMLDAMSRLIDAPSLIWPGDNTVDYYSFYKNV
jgi:predicted phage terminase large subunit-like protein